MTAATIGARTAEQRVWRCEKCGKEEKATVHRMRNRFCSRSCSSESVIKNSATTWQKRRAKLAEQIKSAYESGTTFAEVSALIGLSRSRISNLAKEFGIRARKSCTQESCVQCGKAFIRYPSQTRRFCSYQCHVDNGGAVRAGEASVMALKKYGAKKDANHSIIFEMIGALTAVKDLSAAGFGVPDGLAWVNNGWHLFDVKNPKTSYGKRGLNSRQKTWADDWRGGPVYLIYTVEEAKDFAMGKVEKLKKFPDDAN